MNGQQYTRLVEVIARTFSLKQLDMQVKQVLRKPLEYYAIGPDMLTVVDTLITKLDLEQKPLLQFLVYLRLTTRAVDLRATIDEYLDLTATDPNPYQALIVLDELFVDREFLRQKLLETFEGDTHPLLTISGPVASGKSHSRWLIQYVARQRGINFVLIRLAGKRLNDIIFGIVNDMHLPPTDVRDRLAPVSSLGGGFASVLRGFARQSEARDEHWCLVFDGYDPAKLMEGVEEFVETLMENAADMQLANVRLIVLGSTKPIDPRYTGVLNDEISHLTRGDIQRFLEKTAADNATPLSVADRERMLDTIFSGLAAPLDHDAMTAITKRLRSEIETLVKP